MPMNSDFFYQCLPNKMYQLKSEKCSGGKLSKIRITGMAAASATGVRRRKSRKTTVLQKC